MKLQERIFLFGTLGNVLQTQYANDQLDELLYAAKAKNPWFTIDNLKLSVNSIIHKYLNTRILENFCLAENITEPLQPLKVGIIAAGNIPLVAFQDILHTILSGHVALVKPSSQDEVLLRYIYSQLIAIDTRAIEYFEFVDRVNSAHAYIATGSGNTSRYFEYYFATKPHIIRKNRTSLAILTGNETNTELANLANDIFMYFGLGCRNVSKLFVPIGYNFDRFFENIEYWSTVNMHSKYFNNYEYMKAIYLVNREPHLDNGFLLLKENSDMASPISVLHYSYYNTLTEVNLFIDKNLENIQLIAAQPNVTKNSLAFGSSQEPNIDDYADGFNTINFLRNLNLT